MIDELDRARRTLITKSTSLPRSVFAALGLGAAFGLGTLAGGIGQARGASPVVQDVLAGARSRSEVLEQKRGELRLAFPAELLAPEARGSARAAKPVSMPAAKAPAELAQPPAAPPEQAQPDEPPKPAEPEGPAEPTDDHPRPSIQETLAKVLGGAPATASAPAAPKAKTFALQVASLPQRAGAEQLAASLAAQGLSARVVVGEVGGREVYRVRVGSFGERDKAEAAKGKLTMPSFIVSE